MSKRLLNINFYSQTNLKCPIKNCTLHSYAYFSSYLEARDMRSIKLWKAYMSGERSFFISFMVSDRQSFIMVHFWKSKRIWRRISSFPFILSKLKDQRKLRNNNYNKYMIIPSDFMALNQQCRTLRVRFHAFWSFKKHYNQFQMIISSLKYFRSILKLVQSTKVQI